MSKRTDNIGSLSRNKRKEKETHPDHKGSCTIAGVDYWISAYINESRDDGGKYFRLYFEPKKTEANGSVPSESADLSASPDIPF